MPFPISYPLVNGHRYSFASLEIRINGNPIATIGIKSINYKPSLAPGKMRGTGAQVQGRTRGEHDNTADMEMYRLEWDLLRSTLGAGGIGYGEVPFDIAVSYSELAAPVVTDMILGCRITETDYSNSEGTDASSVKLTLDPMLILEGGVGSIVNYVRA